MIKITKKNVLEFVAIIFCLKSYNWAHRKIERVIIDLDKEEK